MIIIKPKVKFVMWMMLVAFLLCSTMLVFSPFFETDWQVWSTALLLLSFAITVLWIIDQAHMTIKHHDEILELTGYFGGRYLKLETKDIKGYQVKQKVDKYNGLHDEFQLVTTKGRKIILPYIAYPEYGEVFSFCKMNYEFLGYQPIKYAFAISKIVSLIGIISGIFALLVAIRKFM